MTAKEATKLSRKYNVGKELSQVFINIRAACLRGQFSVIEKFVNPGICSIVQEKLIAQGYKAKVHPDSNCLLIAWGDKTDHELNTES